MVQVDMGLTYIRCAFVNFKDRAAAEIAAQAWANGLDIDGSIVSVKWGRSKKATTSTDVMTGATVATM
jgi:pre-mRNA-splicing factor RBM22/SLT11